jgi:hypothetical protein
MVDSFDFASATSFKVALINKSQVPLLNVPQMYTQSPMEVNGTSITSPQRPPTLMRCAWWLLEIVISGLALGQSGENFVPNPALFLSTNKLGHLRNEHKKQEIHLLRPDSSVLKYLGIAYWAYTPFMQGKPGTTEVRKKAAIG